MMFGFSRQYNDLMKKKRIVENDKKKIMATIQELDEKKNEALKKAWAQVNKVRSQLTSSRLQTLASSSESTRLIADGGFEVY